MSQIDLAQPGAAESQTQPVKPTVRKTINPAIILLSIVLLAVGFLSLIHI